MSENTWAGIRERVLRLAGQPGAGKVFGARGHGFHLGPVMSEEEVRGLETDLGAGLPAEYRSFLFQVGSGGAGPDYGLMTPAPGVDGWRWHGAKLAYPARSTAAKFAGRPFVAPDLQPELDALDAEEPDRNAFADDESFSRVYAPWEARYDELYDAQEAGAVFLGDQGCGYASLLVMTGPHQGAVWEDLRPMDEGIKPTGYGFARWYRNWLERTEQQLGLTPPMPAPAEEAP
ncbi:SMI1/KNR4 family protein [Streptomyces sp. NPDC046203]|uniref:SMI1/KNR4 family protein n=1 Tax=Streptomyces sp. NPDC046203 TaxID=3154602 RepID=UPI0034057FA7